MAFELIEEEKKNQQTRINQAMEKVKKLLFSWIEPGSYCPKIGTEYEEVGLQEELMIG
jgi:hypothetical protein